MKPMLAVEPKKPLKFPLYASPKLDGVRALMREGVVLSRTLKPIPNRFVQGILGPMSLHGFDGELIVGSAVKPNCMQTTMSGVMSRDGSPDFTYYVFDRWDRVGKNDTFRSRLDELLHTFEHDLLTSKHNRVHLLTQYLVETEEDLHRYEQRVLDMGYEGVILRNPNGLYKYGRSTEREAYLLKLKRFVDSEAEVLDFEELLHNGNQATIDECGYTQRSSHKDGKVPMNTLGALVVRDVKTGIRFNIGTGYTAAQRKSIWQARETLRGKLVTYKHFEVGVKEAPRFPVFKSFRDEIDIG